MRENNSVHNKSIGDLIPFVLVYYEGYRFFKDANLWEKRLKQFKNGYTELKKRIKHSSDEA